MPGAAHKLHQTEQRFVRKCIPCASGRRNAAVYLRLGRWCIRAAVFVNMRSILLMALILLARTLAAQPPNSDCANAVRICAHSTVQGDNTGAGAVPGFCPGTLSMVWYTFVTNSVGGTATVSIAPGDCVNAVGYDDELNAVVLSGDGTCTLTSFAAVSPCEESDIDFTVTTQALAPNTTYWIVVSGAMNNGTVQPAQCSFDISISGAAADIVGVDMSAGTDRTIGQGESTQLDAHSTGPIDWSPTSGLSGNGIADPIAAPSETTTYWLTTQISGCTYSDDVVVEVVRRIDPPNTFTPNGDGYNDTWAIAGMDDYPGAEVVIHDRWGQVVFRSNGYRDPWDGTNNGRALSVGTYYYHIKLNQLEGRSPPYTGFVTIVR